MMHTMAFAVPPEAPSGVQVEMDGAAARLRWKDESACATGFVVQRSTAADFSQSVVELPAGEGGCLDRAVQPGAGYHYRVKAVNTVGDATDYGNGTVFPVRTAASAWSAPVYLAPHQATALVSSEHLQFHDQRVATVSDPLVVDIGNTGDSALACSIGIQGAGAADYSCPIAQLVVAPGASTGLAVVFAPAAAGLRTANLVLTTNDPDRPSITVALEGRGIAPRASIVPGAIGFGAWMIGHPSTARTATLTNTGSDTLSYSLAMAGADAADFQSSASCAPVLAPGQSCPIQIVFTPSMDGARSAALVVASDDPLAPVVSVPLSGTGTPTPGATDLSATIAGPTRVTLSFTDASTSETAFIVWRAANAGMYLPVAVLQRGAAQSAAIGGTASVDDDSVVAGNMYSYFVTASDGATLSPASNTASVAFTVPLAPSNLVGAAVGIAGDELFDLASLDWLDNSSNETAFEIQRSTSPLFDAPDSHVGPADIPRFEQTVSRDSDYYYRVRARNLVGASGWSGPVLVTTP